MRPSSSAVRDIFRWVLCALILLYLVVLPLYVAVEGWRYVPEILDPLF